jgi:predicted  nucleic acid-binding Zn-ribbon protein
VIKQSRVAEAESKLSELLSAATSKLIPLLNAPSLDTNKLEADLRAILQSYALAPGGPSKFKKCVEFLVNTVIAGMCTGINKSSAALLNASTQLELLKKEASNSKEVIRDLNHRITLLESSAASAKSQISSAQQECERLRRDLSDRVQSEARLRSEEEQARRKILDLERSISTMHAEEGSLKSELGRVRLELSQRSETASALTAELAKAHAEFRRLEQEGRDRGSAHSSLSLEVQALTSKLIERDATIKALQEERNQLTRLALPAQRPAPPPPAAAASLNEAMDVDEAIESGVGSKRRRVTPQGQGHQAALVTNVVAPPAAAHASSTPHEREVEMGRRRSGPQGGAPLSGHTEPENLSKMTVQEMKAWLTERQFEADVFELNSKKPKKQDWSNLISSKCV